MGFVNFAIDLAAVLNASRSVAAKHVALRARQLDVYSRTSSVASVLRSKAAGPVQTEASEQKEPADGGEAVGKEAVDVEDVGERSSEPASEGLKPADFKLHEQPNFKTSLSGSDFVRQPINNAPANTPPAQNQDQIKEELDVPQGIDVNIFHTARGSQILDSLRKQGRKPESRKEAAGGAGKEHPLRYWPRPPPVVEDVTPSIAAEAEANIVDAADEKAQHSVQQSESVGTTTPESTSTPPPEPQAVPETVPEAATEVAPEPATEDITKASPEPVPKTSPEISPETSSSPHTITEEPQSSTKKVDEEIVEAVKAAAIPEAPPVNIPTYQLRESKVPATRFSRILNYGGLAAGLFGGAVTESVSRAFGGGGEGSVLLSGGNMERLVAKLSQMRGAALKLGQMMSFQDSKTMPAPLQEVLQRVQDRADYMPAWQRDRVLVSNLGSDWRDLFSEFEEKPIAAASIGQVHRAVLKSNGKRVAVKIQFPGVADSINSDLDNLGILLTATKLLPKGLYLNKTIDNARLELGWECDYTREAECATRYKELLQGEEDVFEAPNVHLEASGKQVLTMDFLDGIGVTRVKSFTQEQRDWIGTQILRLCLREITEFKFMQTDPNWTNFLYNAGTNKLELLDFGASREFPEEFISQYVQLLECASRSDRAGVKKFSEGLGYLTGHESRTMLDAHIQSVLTLAEPFLESAPEVYDFKDQTITERVRALIPVMLNERLAPPPEETYSLHRKLSGAFLLCARLESKVRCRELFANSVAKSGYVERS
ncbi:molecular chaperone, contains ABC-1 domain [Trichoderma guizhouense]|uniref:Molecular chaperone, contains ABC-1 domain n=1 Tax=Trichoderma guizhouense TaxID=1491466 RepID=A0A1T3CFV6_9HYPO|nr:molecular chaperone, contains ABC-1 domain [Trichoderma guizhouense]